jgi:hypothetical protein
MSINTQPPPDLRPRYKSDGKRQIEKSRTKPMVVKVTINFDHFSPNQFYCLVTRLKRYPIGNRSTILTSAYFDHIRSWSFGSNIPSS